MFAEIQVGYNKLTIVRAAKVLSSSDRKKILAVLILQIILGLLDLFGIALIGVLGALAVTGVSGISKGNRINLALNFLNIESLNFQNQVALLGMLAAICLVSRTLISIFFTKRTLFFLSRRSAALTSSLLSKVLTRNILFVQSRIPQELLYTMTSGVNAIILGIIGSAVGLVSDLSILIIVSSGLFIIDPAIAFVSLIVFGMLGAYLYRLSHHRARKLGQQEAYLNVLSSERILQVFASYRENIVRNRRAFHASEISKLRYELADIQAELAFMPNASKYVIETAVIVGALCLAAFQFMNEDAVHAVATLSVFLAAGTRIAPAVLRLQTGATAIRGSLGTAGPTMDLIEEMKEISKDAETPQIIDAVYPGFTPEIKAKSLHFTYPTKMVPAVKGLSAKVEAGQFQAIVGSSGAGKTTAVDLILGILDPDKGEVLISGLPPLEAFAKWPGAVSYVPQDVIIIRGSIRENIEFGLSHGNDSEKKIWEALSAAQLEDFVRALPEGLDAQVGDRGSNLSGGQRQRLGIARALYSQPQILVLDEATSALDGETELAISTAITKLKGKTTLLVIAHRLSTILNADKIYFMENGELQDEGNFHELKDRSTNFQRQAEIMGL